MDEEERKKEKKRKKEEEKRKEKRKKKKRKKKRMTVSLGTSLASEGICLFFDLWEAQPFLWDPE